MKSSKINHFSILYCKKSIFIILYIYIYIYIRKNLEKYVNKANNTDNGSPARIRKLSDLVVMPEEHIKFAQSPFIERKTTSPYKNDITLSAEMPRIRKNSFKMCNENEVENNKKLENLKRKIVIKDVLEKKQKI